MAAIERQRISVGGHEIGADAQAEAGVVESEEGIGRRVTLVQHRRNVGSVPILERGAVPPYARSAYNRVMNRDLLSRRTAAAARKDIGIPERVAALDWSAVAKKLDEGGYAVTDTLLTAEECGALAAAYDAETRFRSRVVMAHHGFGRGEYKYFAYPLPEPVAQLRAAVYPELASIANRWNEWMNIGMRYPRDHLTYLGHCHHAGQTKPTPLLLQYGPGDYNCLHQDLYGEHVFPLQFTILLSRPGCDFTGGEFVLVEQQPRMQSRAEVVPLREGQGVIFPVNHRPVRGTRGFYRVTMRHGVSRLLSGRRHTLGIILHDAK
jgi:hypothetical protein